MKMEAIQAQGAGATRGIRSLAAMPPAFAMAAAALVAVAIQSLWLPVDADVSWLITVSERVLAGDRLYVDILEVNPPASVWLYVPSVFAAKLLAIKPEAAVVATFVAAGLASVTATLVLASRLRDAPGSFLLAAALSFVALVLPMALFAQREHAALLLALPALAAVAVIAEARPIGRPALYASGFAAGLIIVIKPHFLAAVIAPALWAAYRRRSLSPLLPGIAAAAAAIFLYAFAVAAFAASYFDLMPVIAQFYAPMRAPWWKVAVGPTLYPAICLGLVMLLRPPRIPSLATAWALGAAGFLLAAFVQGKNYPNHWLPQAGLALSAAFAVLVMPRLGLFRRAAVGVGLAVVALCEMYYWTIVPDPAVASEIRRVAPEAPKMISLSPQLTTGHPVVRNVGGRWVGSRAGQFTASGVKFVGVEDQLSRQAYREDVESFASDVRRHSPDVVLVHKPSKAWLMREDAIARAMTPYALATATEDTEIWLRRDAGRQLSADR